MRSFDNWHFAIGLWLLANSQQLTANPWKNAGKANANAKANAKPFNNNPLHYF
ncbi:MAG: hypothetical protein PHU33_02790 [Bacteroidales bacterium]|nr:hypothetical protein [Bacteroidales bacterium]